MYAQEGSSTKTVPLQGSTGNRVRFAEEVPEHEHSVPVTTKNGKNWTLWTVRDPVLADIFGSNPKSCGIPETIQSTRIRMSKKEVMELINQSLGSFTGFRGLKNDFIAVQPKVLEHPTNAVRNENIWMGQTFSYNHILEKLDMHVQEIVFQGGKVSQKTNSGIIRLKTYLGLAQILAASIKKNDVLLISGISTFLGNPGEEHRELSLNGRDRVVQNVSAGNHVDIIRICFDIPGSSEIRLIERIRSWKNQFQFVYAGSSAESKRSVECVRFREFNLGMGPHKLSLGLDLFPMPITREGNATEAFYILMGVNSQPKKHRSAHSNQPNRPKTSRYSKLEPTDDSDGSENDESFCSASDTSFRQRRVSTHYYVNERYWCERSGLGLHRVLELLGLLMITLFFIGIIYYGLSFSNFLPNRAYSRAYDDCQREDRDFLASTEPAAAAPASELEFSIPPVVENYWY